MFWVERQHLSWILAYYMIEIADRVHLLDEESSKNAIIKDTYDQWMRMAAFRWRETYEIRLFNEEWARVCNNFCSNYLRMLPSSLPLPHLST